MSLGTVKTPTIQQIGQVAVELGFNFNDADLAAHLEALGPAFAQHPRPDAGRATAGIVSALSWTASYV